ncbi:MAG: hypothetical protein GXX10_05210 [Clostridiaceae bacterium]|nr:hypothetical protein [Clostridiaceae bacterium]
MIKHNIEKLKTILLIFLIITSFIQIGIHWNQQNQGFPFRFIAQIFNVSDNSRAMDVESLKLKYFVPESIIVSRSLTASKWRLGPDDSFFQDIWNDMTNNYLPSILRQKPNKVLPESQWSVITSTNCINIEFPLNWPNEIIYWFENIKPGEVRGFGSLKSIAIVPGEDVNKTINTLYVYDGSQVYQYMVNIKEDFLPKDFYAALPDILEDQDEPVLYSLPFESSKDILVHDSVGDTDSYHTLYISIPQSITLDIENIESEALQESILLNQKDSFMVKYNESVSEILFTDTENLYKLYKNSILEYKYLPESNKRQAGSVSASFAQAISFIELRRGLLGNIDLILTDIKEAGNYYEMFFDYSYRGTPVYCVGLNGRIMPSITIKANEDRVLECKWVIRSFEENDKPKNYSLYFSRLMNELIPATYPEILTPDDGIIYFERIEPAYFFNLNSGNRTAVPNWAISSKTRDYFIPLAEEG